MDYPKRKHPRLKAYDYSQTGMYFVTICTECRSQILSRITDRQVFLSEVGEICRSFLNDIPNHYPGVHLDQYVIMPDHIHILLWINEIADIGGQRSGRPTLMNIIHAFERLTTRASGIDLWQPSFYEHIVRNEADLHEIRTYIQNNPTAWELLP